MYTHLSNQFIMFVTVFTVAFIIYGLVGFKFLMDKINERRKPKADICSALSQTSASEHSSHLRKFSSVDHKFVMETLKKRPSKSILMTAERKSVQIDTRQSINRQSEASNFSRNSAGSNIMERNSVGFNSDEIESNRKSNVSIKSVTFNEKTQVRRIKKVKKKAPI